MRKNRYIRGARPRKLAQDTVEVILVATDRVLSRVGLDDATTREIAAVAG